MPEMSVSIVSTNEAHFLGACLDSLAHEAQRLALEVWVVDNASTDDTARVAAERGCRVATVTPRNIGAVRNGGAGVAAGEIIAFVDADSRIHPDSFIAIDEAMREGRVVGGSTGCTLERWSLGLAVTYAVMVPMVWVTRMDTGMVFARRADFVRLGGYPEAMRVAEDVGWLLRLRRDGRSRGQRLVRLRHVKVVFSTRKFDEHGDWHYFGFMAKLPRFFRHGWKLADDDEHYWYKPNR